jgi:hypothetical protein
MKKNFTLLLFAVLMLTVNKSKAQCDAPVNLQVNFNNNVSTFNWDPVPGAISYRFQIKFSYATGWGTLATGLTTNTYSYTGLFQSATFNWRVISYCSPTDSTFSATQTYVVPCEAPNTPVTSNITGTTATISWAPASTLPTLPPTFRASYRVLGSTGAWTLVTSSTTVNSLNLTGLLSNTSYEWCVNKNCSNFNSAPLIGQFTTQYVPCDIPVNLRALNATVYNQVSLTWNHVNGWANYYVQFKKASASNWTTVYVTSNSATLGNLTKETIYDWRVLANCTNANQSVYSDVKQFTTYSNPCMAYGNNVNEGIDFFSLGSISRVSGKEVGGYNNTGLSTDLLLGSTNNIVTISAAYPSGIGYGDYYAVFIDFNKNGTFADAGEQVVAPTVQIISQSANYTSTFSVPNNVPLGVTKMRVVLRRPGSTLMPCATGFQGEVEDYDVNIVSSGNFTSTNLIASNMLDEGVEENSNTIKVTASPNPSAGIFTISVPFNFNIKSFEIINTNGKKIQNNAVNVKTNFKIDLTNQGKGVYLLTVFDKQGNKQTVKLLMQ